MIDSVLLRFGWPPAVIASLYVDDVDYRGLSYLFELIKEEDKRIAAKSAEFEAKMK